MIQHVSDQHKVIKESMPGLFLMIVSMREIIDVRRSLNKFKDEKISLRNLFYHNLVVKVHFRNQ